MSNGLLDPRHGERLARLLGMMGSSHDGEALNAARMADKFVRDHGLTWHQVVNVPIAVPGDAQQLARAILRDHCSSLNERELSFVYSMTRWRRPPTAKQRQWLEDIAQRYRSAA
jgi:hypothetical protein